MKPQKGLGRGLDSLFMSDKAEVKITPMSELTKVQIDKIEANPTQPRTSFDDEQLEELSRSIVELGVIQPITLKANEGGKYTIISGERRWRAAQRAGLTEIPAYIREVDDQTMHAMALVENIQRSDLNPIEVAIGLNRLIEECDLSQERLSQRISMKRSTISNYLRLLKLSDEVQYALKRGLITMGHAKAIASIESPESRVELLKICIEQGISVREAERRAAIAMSPTAKPKAKSMANSTSEYDGLARHLGGIFKGVEIKTNSRGGGRIVINFSNRSEVERLLADLDIK